MHKKSLENYVWITALGKAQLVNVIPSKRVLQLAPTVAKQRGLSSVDIGIHKNIYSYIMFHDHKQIDQFNLLFTSLLRNITNIINAKI